MSTLKRIRDFVRFEAQIPGADTLTGFIDGLLNEVLRQKTALRKCPELLMTDVVIAAVGADNPTFALPADVQTLLKDRVRYDDDGNRETASFLSTLKFGSVFEGLPNRYQRTGTNLVVWPQTISSSAKLYIDYYKYPATMLADSDTFPIPSLEETVKLEVISRVSRMSKSQMAGDFKKLAGEAWSNSEAQQ